MADLRVNVPEFLNWGSPNIGGPVATAGGLIFIGATFDKKIRAIATIGSLENRAFILSIV